MKRSMAGVLFAFYILISATGRADAEAAKAAYMRGIQQEKARNYQAALSEFQTSLRAESGYFWAWKEMGNCYYYLGYKKYALSAYQQYLKGKPGDLQVSTLASSLSGEQDKPATAATSQTAAEPKKLAFTFLGGYDTYAFTNWNNEIANGQNSVISSGIYNSSGGKINGGWQVSLEGRYFFFPNFSAGLFLDWLFAGTKYSSNITNSSGIFNTTASFSFPAILIGPQAVFTFTNPASKINLNAGAGAGFLTLFGSNGSFNINNITSSSGIQNATDTENYSGSGFGFKLWAGGDWFFSPNYSLTANLGYRIADIGEVTNSNGATFTKSDGSNLDLDYSGLLLSFGVSYWL